AGESTYHRDKLLLLERYGYPEPMVFSFSYSPVRDERGVVRGWLATMMETTQVQHAQQQLRDMAAALEQQAALRTADRDRLWNLSDALMIVARFDGTIVAANPGWTAALGWTEVETVGRHIRAFLHEEDASALDMEGALLRSVDQRRH